LLGIVDGDLLELGKSDGDPLGFKLLVRDLLGAKLGVSEKKSERKPGRHVGCHQL